MQLNLLGNALYAGTDLGYLTRAAELADSSAGQCLATC